MSNELDVLIIGAGPAGVSAASLLNGAGLRVGIIEKDRFPRFVIGESLLPRCMDLLEEASLLTPVREAGFQEKHGALFLKGPLSFNLEFANQWSQGWPFTYQVPRDHFDLLLAQTVQKRGVEILFENIVKNVALDQGRPSVVVEDSGGRRSTLRANFLLDGSGNGQVLPKLLGLAVPSPMPARQSIFTHLRGDLRPEGREEGKIWIVAVGPDTWLWIIPFSNGISSVGVVGSPDFFGNIPGGLENKLREALKLNSAVYERIKNATFLFPPRTIQNYSSSVKKLSGPGYALLGNAAGFLDPIFSNGITLALESANRAAKLLIKQLKGETVDWDNEYEAYIMSGFKVFETYINAWYGGSLHSLLHYPQKDEVLIKQIVSILSGYVWDSKNPLVRQPGKRLKSIVSQINLAVNG